MDDEQPVVGNVCVQCLLRLSPAKGQTPHALIKISKRHYAELQEIAGDEGLVTAGRLAS